MDNKHGSELLRQWINDTGRKVTWVAASIPAHRVLVQKWLKRTHTPRPIYRIAIARLTEGAVPVESWESD